MPQGDLTVFNEYTLATMSAVHNLAAAGDVIKVAIITTLPTAADVTPTLGDYTEVVGTGYAAGGIDIQTGQSVTVVSGAQYKYDSSVNPSWSQNGSGFTDGVAALIYNSSKTNQGIAFVDLTTSGGTPPVSLVAGNISVTWNASGIFTVG